MSASEHERMARAAEAGLKHHHDYERVLAQLANLRLAKAIEYGERRYEGNSPEFDQWMCFSDVYRKFIRLETQIKRGDIAGQLESYRDLANYAVMGVQILERLEKEKK